MDTSLRRRLERRLREINLLVPAPFTVEAFRANLAAARGRDIHLVPWDTTGATVPCGLWISTDSADYIIYDKSAAPILQQHIILHEIGHLLLGHEGALDLDSTQPQLRLIDSAVVHRVLGRAAAYAAAEEREAEILASIIGERAAALTPDVPRQARPSDAAVIDRFSAALTADRSWRD